MLAHFYPGNPSIPQVQTMIAEAVQRAITQLIATPPPPGNTHSFKQGARYTQPARTAAEIKATMAQAASVGKTTPVERREVTFDPAAEFGTTTEDIGLPPSVPPPRPSPAKKDSWLL